MFPSVEVFSVPLWNLGLLLALVAALLYVVFIAVVVYSPSVNRSAGTPPGNPRTCRQ